MSNFNNEQRNFRFHSFLMSFQSSEGINISIFCDFFSANAKIPRLSTRRKKQLFRIVSRNNRLDSTWNQLPDFFMASSTSFQFVQCHLHTYALARPGYKRCEQARKHEEEAGRVKNSVSLLVTSLRMIYCIRFWELFVTTVFRRYKSFTRYNGWFCKKNLKNNEEKKK